MAAQRNPIAQRARSYSLALVLALPVASLPGCLVVGIVGIGEREGDATNPHVGLMIGDRRVVDDSRLAEPLPSSKLLAEWGEPDARDEQDDGSELWRYNGFPRWSGVVVCVLLPIPLALPTGLEHVEFTIRDGRVEQAHSSANSFRWGWGCGVAPGFVHGGGAFAESIRSPGDTFCNPFE